MRQAIQDFSQELACLVSEICYACMTCQISLRTFPACWLICSITVQDPVTWVDGVQLFCIDLQTLLLDGIGLTLNDMRRLARWHGRVVNPALASASASVAVAQKIARNRAARRKADQVAKTKSDEVPCPAQLRAFV